LTILRKQISKIDPDNEVCTGTSQHVINTSSCRAETSRPLVIMRIPCVTFSHMIPVKLKVFVAIIANLIFIYISVQ